MLNGNGSIRWRYTSEKVGLARGHCDCFRVVKADRNPEEFRAVMTFCGANAIAMIDGHGRPVWETVGQHFESVDVGRILTDAQDVQLAVDIDHQPWGNGPVWVLDTQGEVRTRIQTDYARHHALLDWTGDGVDEILIAQPRTLYSGAGQPLAELAMDPTDDEAGEERLALTGDFSGDGVPDILLTTRAMTQVLIYRNEHGRRPDPPAPLGTGLNVTLY
jgi:hypothetical protein